jgi:hypothetical protein
MQAPNGQAIFSFQELFVEWKAAVLIGQKTTYLTVKINRISPGDSVNVEPSDADKAALNPEWMSGFQEPAHPNPDYFSQLITFHNLAKGEQVEIRLRRQFGAPAVGSSELPVIEEARTENCSAKIKTPDQSNEAKLLSQQLFTIANFPSGKAPLPLGRDPGVRIGQFEATIEARCENAQCGKVAVKNLEVRKGGQ